MIASQQESYDKLSVLKSTDITLKNESSVYQSSKVH